MKKEIRICLTGHRPDKLDGYDLNTTFYKNMQNYLMSILDKALEKYEKVICSSGLALGADTIWTKSILQMKKKYGDRIEFHAHIPNWNHCNKWVSKVDKNYWKFSIDNADEVHVIDPDGKLYTFGQALNIRNHSMVNMSDVIIAIHDGTTGGTYNCLQYARNKGLKELVIRPSKFKDTCKNNL